MEMIDDLNVIDRLRSPPDREASNISSLIEQYLPEIQEARRNGKTWAMIGRDLRFDDPIKADTARRTVSRLSARKTSKASGRKTIKRKPKPQVHAQLELKAPANNPFARRVDPIREN